MTISSRNEIIYPIVVQFEDVDSYKIVHHTKLIAYLERARVHFLSHIGIRFNKLNAEIIVYSLSITFKKPARFLDTLNVSVRVKSYETFRISLLYRIKRENELIARAETDLAFIDSKTKEILAIPEELLV